MPAKAKYYRCEELEVKAFSAPGEISKYSKKASGIVNKRITYGA